MDEKSAGRLKLIIAWGMALIFAACVFSLLYERPMVKMDVVPARPIAVIPPNYPVSKLAGISELRINADNSLTLIRDRNSIFVKAFKQGDAANQYEYTLRKGEYLALQLQDHTNGIIYEFLGIQENGRAGISVIRTQGNGMPYSTEIGPYCLQRSAS